jgi:hypothetical protein
MLYDEDDEMYVRCRIVPLRGAVPERPTFFRASFTPQEYDALAPPLTPAQWKSVWNNNPDVETRQLMRLRIAVAWFLKYGRRYG